VPLIQRVGPLVNRCMYYIARANPSALPVVDRANLGSANVVAGGWVNLDNSPSAWLAHHHRMRWLLKTLHLIPARLATGWPADVILHDVRRPLPWADGALRYVYTSHLLEHLYPDEGARLLHECFRVLQPGGRIRVVVPDLELFARRYIAAVSDDSQHERDVEAATLELFDICGARESSAFSSRNPHRWMYDRRSLAAALRDAGFVDIARYESGVGDVPDLTTLDVRGDISLHLEARRP